MKPASHQVCSMLRSHVWAKNRRVRLAAGVNAMTSPLCSVRIFSERFARQTWPSVIEGFA